LKLVVLCDFDGTITEIDTAEYVLTKFAQGDWKSIDRRFEDGEITLEEGLQQEFALVKATRKQILDELAEIVTFRPHFEEFAEYCRTHEFPLIIVSAGLDFVIKHYLQQKGWMHLATTYTAQTKFQNGRIEFIFPKPIDDKSINFKHDLVRRCKKEGNRVLYIGDGGGDYAAAKESDTFFVISGSRLEQLCRSGNDDCLSVSDFQEIMEYLQEQEHSI
jgi:2-hydroxy-3-keto-5-methylthiopentenyl-1-phosphate phosphatase